MLVSRAFLAGHSTELAATWPGLEFICLPASPDDRVPEGDCARVDIAYFSGDVFPVHSRAFFAATDAAPNLRWMHVFNAGVDNPVFRRLLERGVRLTTSSGSTAQPIAQTAIGGMLMLSRGFLHWRDAQVRHAWEPIPAAGSPPDLAGQTMTVVGLGAIGAEIARLARAIGLHVVGVRRSPARDDDPVDELVSPASLHAVLPRTDWLALACPLTEETRGLVGREALALLPSGAHVINIARGEVIDEDALVASLESGHLGGAYLDVFAREPLPGDSPLWGMANVIISPHNSAAAAGNAARANAIFLRNLQNYRSETPMENEVSSP